MDLLVCLFDVFVGGLNGGFVGVFVYNVFVGGLHGGFVGVFV